jgi:hypothetical protein
MNFENHKYDIHMESITKHYLQKNSAKERTEWLEA